VRAIAKRLNAAAGRGRGGRAERAPAPDSWTYIFKARLGQQGVTFDSLSKARKLFERALALTQPNIDAGLHGAGCWGGFLLGLPISRIAGPRTIKAVSFALPRKRPSD